MEFHFPITEEFSLFQKPGGTMQTSLERSVRCSVGQPELLKTRGEIEAAICEGMTHFQQKYMGRGPADIHAHLIGDLLVVRLQAVLTVAERNLVHHAQEKGRDLLKQIRGQLIDVARPTLESLVQGVTGVKVLSLHHDISTVTDEQVVVFTLAKPPHFRETKKKRT